MIELLTSYEVRSNIIFDSGIDIWAEDIDRATALVTAWYTRLMRNSDDLLAARVMFGLVNPDDPTVKGAIESIDLSKATPEQKKQALEEFRAKNRREAEMEAQRA